MNYYFTSSREASASQPARQSKNSIYIDYWLLGSALLLVFIGLIAVGSASIAVSDRQMGEPFYYFWRQLAYASLGITIAWGVLHIKLVFWELLGPTILMFSFLLLLLVLLVGTEVNGSTRWFSLGLFNFQPSELMKLSIVIFLAGYLVRRGDEVRETTKGFHKPLILISIIAILLLLEPDFGAAVVIALTTFSMMFLGGVRLRQFFLLLLLAGVALTIIAYTSPYRLERITCFLNPWADPFNCGFQLTQALIAFGRGEWFGVGLGGSIQKLFYLPEAHTDFLFAVLCEELGLLGGVFVILLFSTVVWRAFFLAHIAIDNGKLFCGYLAYGIGLLIGLQAFTNIGVNMGMLPTKGLTLPLMSYGGSSMVLTCIAIALLLRVGHELDANQTSGNKQGIGVR